MQKLSVMVVGEPKVGKTCVLIAYTTNAFPGEYIPTVFDDYPCNVMVDGIPINLICRDSSSDMPTFMRMLQTSEPADVVCLCFSYVDRGTLQCLEEKWHKPIHAAWPKTKFFVTGCKSDLRRDLPQESGAYRNALTMWEPAICPLLLAFFPAPLLEIMKGYYLPYAFDPVEDQDIKEVCSRLRCPSTYASALTPEGLKSVFDEAFRLAFTDKLKYRHGKGQKCSIS